MTSKLTALFSDLVSLDRLPESLEEAFVHSYRLISLLNVDAKNLVKVLVNRLSTIIEDHYRGPNPH